MENFAFYLPTKIIYEVGAVKNKLAAFVKSLDASAIEIITDKGIVNAGLLKDAIVALEEAGIKYTVFDEVEPNPSTDTCVKAYEIGKDFGATAIIAVGGGSPMDVAKAAGILMTNGGVLEEYEGADKFKNAPIPMLFIPTTAGTGSEVTPFAVITIKKRNYKMTIFSNRILPQIALLDPTLISTVPPYVAAACGMDALTHAIESFINHNASPATDAVGAEAMRLIGQNLRAYVANRKDMEAAGAMLIASCLAGIAFANARLGVVHAMAHPLGGFFGVPHGVANAILLPHIMRFNQLADKGKYKRIAGLLGEDIARLSNFEAAPLAVEAVEKLSADIGIPKTLTEVGVKPEVIPEMAEDAMKSANILINPRQTTLNDIVELYHQAM